MSHSYKEFPTEVLEAYSEVIQNHQLKVKVTEDYMVQLINEEVLLKFIFDRGDFYSEIRKTDDDFSFAIWQVRKFLDILGTGKLKYEGYPIGAIKSEADAFRAELKGVFNGDFPWYDDLKREIEYEKKLSSFILGPSMEHSHPISQKFWKREKGWKEDLEEYLKSNNINLK